MMANRKNLVRNGSRVAIGAGLTVAAGLLVTNLGLMPIPEMTREIPAVTVDTEQDSLRSIVCQGPFGELGADSANLGFIQPIGSASIVVSPDVSSVALDAGVDAAQAPTAYSSSTTPPLAGAQVQRAASSNVLGLAANACLEPTNDQWLVGGSTARGLSSTLTLSNPGVVPATVTVTVHDETGEEASSTASGVLVPAGAQRSVSLNGYATGRESIAVHVVSAGSAVTAVMGVSQIMDITPVGADHVTAQAAPTTQLAFPGVINYVDHLHTTEEDHHEDEYPVAVRLFAPDGSSGTAEIVAITDEGERLPLATATITAGAVTDTIIEVFPEEANAILVTASVPVVGGVSSSVHVENAHDFAWHTPAPELQVGDELSTVLVSDGETYVVNLGAEEAELTILETLPTPEPAPADEEDSDADDEDSEAQPTPEPKTVTIGPGAAVTVDLPRTAILSSTQPIAAAVSIYPGEMMSSYPLVPGIERFTTLNVYTR